MSMAALRDAGPGVHLVHFYADERGLATSIAGFLGTGMGRDEAAVVIAELAHRRAVGDELRRSGIPLDAEIARGALVMLDSAETLERFMDDGEPDPARFEREIGAILSDATTGREGVRVYGEMVGTLWEAANITGALALEELWNDLSKKVPFSLYCGYRSDSVAGADDITALDAACRLHSAVAAEGDLEERSSAHRRFAAHDGAPSAAREFVVAELSDSDDPALCDAAALVVSELATNAIVHGKSAFTVSVSALARTVRISVRDGDTAAPVRRDGPLVDPRGRGLRIVDAISRDWGTTACYDGKVVWAELDRPPRP